MAFQFVNSTPDRPEHDDETRRRIRSQAMRNFRQRQRTEESTAKSEELSSSTSSPQGSSPSVSRRESRKRKGSTQSLPLSLEASRRPSSGQSQTDSPLVETAGSPVERRPSMKSAVSDDQTSPNRVRRAKTGVFSTFSVQLPSKTRRRRPPLDDANPLESPGLERLLDLCESYDRWLDSEWPSESQDDLRSHPPNDTTSQMLLYARCLRSIGHLDALRPGQVVIERDVLKTKTLALINKRVRNPAKALEDDTIRVLACLTSFEMSRGSTEALLHLHGLSQIAKLRGGTESIGNIAGLAMFLEMLDLIHAVYFHSSPIYTTAVTSQPSSSQQTPQLAALDTPALDQAMLDELSDYFLSIPDRAEQDVYPDTLALQPSITPSTLESEVAEWLRYLERARNSTALGYEGALAHVCGLAADLHLADTSPIAPSAVRLQAQTEQLYNAMHRLPEDAWDAFQTLHLRVLLTALSTAGSVPQRSWYNAHLTRCLHRTEGENWVTVKQLMVRFIQMQSMVRWPRRQTVRALANDIEVVVDPAEAVDQDMDIL